MIWLLWVLGVIALLVLGSVLISRSEVRAQDEEWVKAFLAEERRRW